ncbi:MAG: NUDIX domain-containing protein [Bacteroidetes bacterium]|nr:NUDIX domain-containing protein [Bacteroidota bacterium]MBS1972800.1 NUDIX domain-containing protein [Bacteroidota bacterium]
MRLKVYFNDKPLFLCDKLDDEISKYAHHDDAVLIDEFSPPAVNAMIHEMQQEKVHAGIFLHNDFNELKKAFWKKFTVIKAAGGLVFNAKKEMLFIFRRGKWDLPKGKLDEGETLEQCAAREVGEETGLENISLIRPIMATYHTYYEDGKHILKESHWYEMKVEGRQTLIPQAVEDIHEVKWAAKAQIIELMKNTFPSVKDVIGQYIPGHGPF